MYVTLTWIFVSKSTGNGEDWIKALEYDGVEDHFAIAWLHRQICKVMSQLSQVLKWVQRINLLS